LSSASDPQGRCSYRLTNVEIRGIFQNSWIPRPRWYRPSRVSISAAPHLCKETSSLKRASTNSPVGPMLPLRRRFAVPAGRSWIPRRVWARIRWLCQHGQPHSRLHVVLFCNPRSGQPASGPWNGNVESFGAVSGCLPEGRRRSARGLPDSSTVVLALSADCTHSVPAVRSADSSATRRHGEATAGRSCALP
jgi:hypothetical protein